MPGQPAMAGAASDAEPDLPVVGVIGLGAMGGPIADHLLAAGYRVVGYDVAGARRRALEARGGEPARSVGFVARTASVILTSLPSAAALLEVCGEIAAALEPTGSGDTGSIAGPGRPRPDVVELSTLGLDTERAAAAILARTGVTMVDAALSGTAVQAASGDLVVYMAGDRSAQDRCEAPLRAISRAIHRVGEFGAATTTKLIANHLVATHIAAAAEALLMARLAGLDLGRTLAALTDGAGSSRMLEVRGPMMIARAYEPPSMRLELFLKDLGLIEAQAASLGAPTPLFSAAAELFEASARRSGGGQDTAVVHEWLAGLAGPHHDPATGSDGADESDPSSPGGARRA